MESLLLWAAQWIDAVGIGPWMRGSSNLYPLANVAHVLGAIALVGGIGVVDMRLAGMWRDIPAAPLARALTPIAVTGLIAMLASGTLLFAADAPALAGSGVFQVKLVLIVLALGNALFFRWRWRDTGEWSVAPSRSTRLLAIASLTLWVTIVIAGRMIAYA